MTLPITIVMIDNVAHELARMSIENTLSVIDPAAVLILTDDPAKIPISGADYYWPFTGNTIQDIVSVLWYGIPDLIKTSHILWQQWDSWAVNADRWTDEFLEYDYVGAPWPIVPNSMWEEMGMSRGWNVGNGGFSLRSTELMRYLSKNPNRYPPEFSEDYAICRTHRVALEIERGFRWAPEVLAARFSFELDVELTVGSTFGFHGAFNWPWFLTRAQREARIRAASPYVLDRPSFKQMLEFHELTADPVSGQVVRFDSY